MPCALTPIDVSGLTDAIAISAGDQHTCAVTSTGAMKCWGANGSGQLGDAQACGLVCQTPVDVTDLNGDPLTGIAEVSAGGHHSCARRANDGAVLCWGAGAQGQIGHGATGNKTSATEICAGLTCEALSGADAISLGLEHSCALLDGAVLCWGSNSHGQLGHGGVCQPACDTPIPVALPKGPLPDLAIEKLRVELETGGSCAFTINLGVTVEFRNTGNGDAGPFVVDLDGSQLTASGLAAGASSSLWFPGHTFEEITVTLDATFLVTESDETNNTHTKAPPVPTLPATCTPTPTRTPVATPTPVARAGDANCDGRVNSIDAALVLQRVAGLLGSLPCPEGGDANHDGQTNSIDAALILQYVAGLLSRL